MKRYFSNNWRCLMLVIAAGGLLGLMRPAGAAQDVPEKLPPGANIVCATVFPQTIDLKNPFAYRQVLVTGILSTGESIDVTRMAKFTGPANLVKVSAHGMVRPVAD